MNMIWVRIKKIKIKNYMIYLMFQVLMFGELESFWLRLLLEYQYGHRKDASLPRQLGKIKG